MQETQTKIYYSHLQIKMEKTLLAATENGLCWAGSFNEDFHDMQAWLSKKFHSFTLEENQAIMEPYINQFEEYFTGERDVFDIALDLQGTPFQLAVWESLLKIPYGETRTYTEIAENIGNPKSIRAVGTAIGRNPALVVVPCHRVINKNGELGGFRGGIDLKRSLLELESV